MGAIMNSVSLPPGGQLIYTMRATAGADPASDSLDYNATITPPRDYVDTNPGDNYVTDSVLVGMPASGPDLSINVTETPSMTDSSITYGINVTNNGPGTAGGADVEYDVPPNSTVQIMAGDGWSCNLTADGMQVLCTRTQPIPPGPASPITLVVSTPSGTTQIPLKASVTGTDANGNIVADPDPSNNTVDRMSMLNEFRLEGGGLVGCNCSIGQTPAQAPSGPYGLALGCLFGLGLLYRSQRRRVAKQMFMN
jgi:MYXO-CTERM domain-containing protein